MPPHKSRLFSPVLLAGIVLRPLPRWPLERLLHKIVDRLQKNHPGALERLAPIQGTRFLIRPLDLPYVIRLVVSQERLDVSLGNDPEEDGDVRVSGALMALLDMLDGHVDGDALFFSRDITVEGDTEALLTLRNALDSEDINLEQEMIAALGPFGYPAGRALQAGKRLYRVLTHDMAAVERAVTAPLEARLEQASAEHRHLADKIANLEKALTRTRSHLDRLNKKVAS